MSFHRLDEFYAELSSPNTTFICLCNDCLYEFERTKEPDTDEETGKVVYHKPTICPKCFGVNLVVSEE